MKPAVKPEVVRCKPRRFRPPILTASLKAVSGRDHGRCQVVCRLVQAGGSRDLRQGGRRFAETGLANPDREGCFQPASGVGDRRLGEEALDDKATKGGIVLAGTVTGLADEERPFRYGHSHGGHGQTRDDFQCPSAGRQGEPEGDRVRRPGGRPGEESPRLSRQASRWSSGPTSPWRCRKRSSARSRP